MALLPLAICLLPLGPDRINVFFHASLPSPSFSESVQEVYDLRSFVQTRLGQWVKAIKK
jgi:hypothetical protein